MPFLYLHTMKKLLILLHSVLLLNGAFAQDTAGVYKGDFQIDVGGGLGAYFFHSNLDLKSGLGAVTGNTKFNLLYSVKQDLYLGLGFRVGNVLTDNEVRGADSIPTTVYATASHLNLKVGYYFVNKPRFMCNIGAGMGVAALYYEETENEVEGYFKAGGSFYCIDLGMKKLFTKWLGIFVNADYTVTPLTMTELYNGVENLDTYEGKELSNIHMNMSGFNLEAGLTFQF